MESLILKLIKENNDWESYLNDLDIKVRFSDDNSFAIFNYSFGADFSNKIVQEARGIIIDLKGLKVACWPFRKFGNYTEEYCDDIDWSTARVQEKLDGSIVKLWYNNYSNEWQWSTNGVIDAKLSDSSSLLSKTFYDIIIKANNFKDIDLISLDKNKTYIFELVGPENCIVVHYDDIYLYHIGTRNNITGEESNDDIGIEKPHEYKLQSFEETLEAVENLNRSNRVEHEGFVVVDNNWNRIKIKNAEYLVMHHLANNGILVTSKSKILELLRSDDFNEEEILRQYPEYEKIFNHYKSEIARVEKEVEEYIKYIRDLYKNISKNESDHRAIMKELAEKIKLDKYKKFGFSCIKNKVNAKELLYELPDSKYSDLISDYVEVLDE